MITIVSSVISAFVSIAICMINNSKQVAVIQTKLEDLTKEVEKHNKVVERTYELEKKVALIEKELELQ